MSRPAFASLALLASLASTGALHAQELALPSPSPGAKVAQTVGVTDISVDYSSPGVKGRKIWGALVPYDQLWRAGANSATKLTVSRDVKVGGVPLKAGSYALYMTPGKTSWTVHLNTNWDTGGTSGYDAKNDVVKITVKPTALPAPRERLAYLFADTTDDATQLDLEWEKLRIRIPITVDTRAIVDKAIEQALDNVWRPHFSAARYRFDTNELDQALALVDRSIAIQPSWRAEWLRAQIQEKKGNKVEARASATRAQQLGAGNPTYEQFFKADIAKALAGWK